MVFGAPHLELNSEELKAELKPKTKEEVYEVYDRCASLTKTDYKVLKQFKANIFSDDSGNLIQCVYEELGILNRRAMSLQTFKSQFSVFLGIISIEHLKTCLDGPDYFDSLSDNLVYFHECAFSDGLWKKPSGDLTRENKQACQSANNITQYEICHGMNQTRIVKYSVCDNYKSGVYQGNESIGFSYNFYRTALYTFAYLPPYVVYSNLKKCMKQGRDYSIEELPTVMACINNLIPTQWKPKRETDIPKSVNECKAITDLSDDLYELLKQKTVKPESLDYLRCIDWQLGLETGGCYISDRTVTQLKLLNPTIDETIIKKTSDDCYNQYLTTWADWDELKYHQCLISMEGVKFHYFP